MKLLAFAVYDSKAEAYLRPFFAETKGLALRAFMDGLHDPQSPMAKHPEDYTLFEIGEYHQLQGKLVGRDAFDAIGNGLTFLQVSA